MAAKGILVIGSANMDLVVSTRHFPRPGETVFGERFGIFPGGKGANQAVCAAKLGSKVYFIGKMGKDMFGAQLVKGMRRSGVRMQHVVLDEETPTGVAVITIDAAGQNQIIVASGSNMKLTPLEIDQKEFLFVFAAVTVLQLEIPLDTIIRSVDLARKHGHTIILNPAPARKLPSSLLRLVDYLTPNETEAEILTGIHITNMQTAETAAKKLRGMGVDHVIITMGKKGCLVVSANETVHYPAPQVRVVDTVAAGDALNGALAVALAESKPLPEAVQFAVKTASLSVTRMGAQSSMPVRQEVEDFERIQFPVLRRSGT